MKLRTLEEIRKDLAYSQDKLQSLPSYLGSHDQAWKDRIAKLTELIDAIQYTGYGIREGYFDAEEIQNMDEDALIAFVRKAKEEEDHVYS